jgi:DNA-binding MarR family transcriptional regulator
MAHKSVTLLYSLREAADAYDERMIRICGAAGLSHAQFNLLFLVVVEGPTRLSELAKNRRCVRSNVSYLVKHMEKGGLLKLVADRKDRRVRYVHASQKGQKAFRRVLSDAAQLELDVRAAIGAKSTDDLAERLMRVAQALDGT